MTTIRDEIGYRKACKRYAKLRSYQRVEDGLSAAKGRLMDILGNMEDLGIKNFCKLNTIICKIEALENQLKFKK